MRTALHQPPHFPGLSRPKDYPLHAVCRKDPLQGLRSRKDTGRELQGRRETVRRERRIIELKTALGSRGRSAPSAIFSEYLHSVLRSSSEFVCGLFKENMTESEVQHGFCGLTTSFFIDRHSPVVFYPRERSFYDPS